MSAREDVLKMVREAQGNLLASQSSWSPELMLVRAREILARGAEGQSVWTSTTMAAALLLTALEAAAVAPAPEERRKSVRRSSVERRTEPNLTLTAIQIQMLSALGGRRNVNSQRRSPRDRRQA